LDFLYIAQPPIHYTIFINKISNSSNFISRKQSYLILAEFSIILLIICSLGGKTPPSFFKKILQLMTDINKDTTYAKI